jgi:hypothetical protein
MLNQFGTDPELLLGLRYPIVECLRFALEAFDVIEHVGLGLITRAMSPQGAPRCCGRLNSGDPP